MKKALIATSVAVALSGCGGGSSDSGSSTSSSSTSTFTAIDGYLKNAVVFIDTDKDGEWDSSSDTLLGLTDESGTISTSQSLSADDLVAVQTLIPGGDKQSELLTLDPDLYAGLYTVDMDNPGQAMQYEVVFRAPTSSSVITPITSLVANKMAAGSTEEEAVSEVKTLLDLTEDSDAVYSDYINASSSNNVLHKLAQSLTIAQANDVSTSDSTVATLVTAIGTLSDEALENKNYQVVLSSDGDAQQVSTSTNTKLTVDSDIIDILQAGLDNLTLTVNGTLNAEFDLSNLMSDTDQQSIALTLSDATISTLSSHGIDYTLTDQVLTLTSDGLKTAANDIQIVIQADDYNSAGTDMGTVSTTVTFDIDSSNAAPSVDEESEITIAETIASWSLQSGVDSTNSVDISSLFSDEDTLIYTAATTDSGLEASISQGLLTVTGTPTNSGTVTISLSANDGINSEVTATFLATVTAGNTDSSDDEESSDEQSVALAFTSAMFNGQTWKMGTFNAGDNELAYVRFTTLDSGAVEFCITSENKISDSNSSVYWQAQLESADNRDVSFDDAYCVDGTLTEEGTLVQDDGTTFSVAYLNQDGNDYQLIAMADDEMLWLDSSEAAFEQFLNISHSDDELQYTLADDRTDRYEVEPLLDTVLFSLTDGESTSGTYLINAYGYDVTADGFQGSWSQESNTVLNLVEPFDGSYDRNNYRVRDFGDISIYITDKYADGVDGYFQIKSNNADTLLSLYRAWVAGNSPANQSMDDLVDQTLYSIVASEDDDNISDNLCHALRFNSDGTWDYAEGTSTTECNAALVEMGTYSIADDVITAEFTETDEDGNEFTGNMTFTVKASTDDGSQYVLSSVSVNEGLETFTVFTSQTDAQARLNIQSDNDASERQFTQLLNLNGDDDYREVLVTVALRASSEDSGLYDADVFFDSLDGSDITCEMVTEHFDTLTLVGTGSVIYPDACFDNEENNVSYATWDIDIYSDLNVDSVYGFSAQSSNGYTPDVNLSVTWTGTGNNE